LSFNGVVFYKVLVGKQNLMFGLEISELEFVLSVKKLIKKFKPFISEAIYKHLLLKPNLSFTFS